MTGNSFGAWLAKTRKTRGLTLRDVERITEGRVSNSYLSQLEGGSIKQPSVIMLHRLAAALAVDFVDLCARACVGSEPPPPPPICPTCGQVVEGDSRC